MSLCNVVPAWLIQQGYFPHKSCLLALPMQCSLNTPARKPLCNVVLEALDSIAQEKILYNAVLTLLGQYYTSKNPMSCCP